MFDFNLQFLRGELYRRIRSFFDGREYLEVFTPTLSEHLIPEANIKAFATRFENEFVASEDLYLIPSPELFMKQLLAAGSPSIYQISTCFRNCEQLGRVHNPEFTMLEYYTLDYTADDSIPLTEELLHTIAFPETPSYALPPFRVMSVSEAMERYAGVDIEKCQREERLREEASRLGLTPDPEEPWDDTFNRIFLTFVEPSLPKEKPVVLKDYPMQIDCLAKQKRGTPFRNRWELYIAGTEVANCYSEETSTVVTKAYYKREQKRILKERSMKGEVIPAISDSFPLLKVPKSSGVAAGLDRLLMCLLGKEEIAPLLLFPLSDMIHRSSAKEADTDDRIN